MTTKHERLMEIEAKATSAPWQARILPVGFTIDTKMAEKEVCSNESKN